MNKKEREEKNCQNIMEALMNQISFENYRDWLDENIIHIINSVLLEETHIVGKASQIMRIKYRLLNRITTILQASLKDKPAKPELWDESVETWSSNAAEHFLKSLNIDLSPGLNEGTSLEDKWIVVTIGEGIPSGGYWWVGYFNLGWKYIYPRTIVPKWDISLITGVKS